MYLAQNLKYLREKNEKQQKDLALLLNISEATMSKYENGFVEPDLKKIIAISVHYSVTIDDLVLKDLRPPTPRYVKKHAVSPEETKYVPRRYRASAGGDTKMCQ